MTTNHGVRHLGIIMDGNRRWARGRRLPLMAGHERGYATFKRVGDWCIERGIDVLTVFAFSTENWQRSKKEVDFLMRLTVIALTRDLDELHRKNICIKVIGRINELPQRLQQHIATAMEKTKHNTKGTLQVAFNYGGRAEIVDAVRKVYRTAQRASQITEKTIGQSLYTANQPDPDMIIRTSGELRLSNFLVWQGVYSELYFLKKNWPDFSERDLDEALDEFKRRQRRFGA